MELFTLLWDNVVPFVFVLTVLVFVHEMGHYWVARRCGVRIEVFSIGFGPELFGWNDRAGTRWKVSAVPLGGYVKMFGEGDTVADADGQERVLSDEEKKVSFAHKRLGQRAAIVAAGPIANFLLAIVLLGGLFGLAGTPRLLPVVAGVQAGSAAEAAGIRPGDRILSVAGEDMQWFDDLRRVIAELPGVEVDVLLSRDDAERTLKVTPKAVPAAAGGTQMVGQLGVTADPAQVGYLRYGPATAAWKAVETTVVMSGRILGYLGQIIVGARPADEVGGPLRIAQMSAEVAAGGFVNLINFMAVLSINLGLINLFPIPMLDGGHLVFFMAEGLRGRPLGPRTQEYGFRFGLILVFLLMIFATWNDLVYHFKVIELIKQLVT
ncbi:RIP metalloprotease RseP [Shumkonia mesophila]|uniref:RIP metalloprotease RseP n=1 Tax=Shumkonia mesophila TaxID=2838854 RepID=UPI002934436F|nr:RIP metalloprotease RseP [Shumkonia mesophila]